MKKLSLLLLLFFIGSMLAGCFVRTHNHHRRPACREECWWDHGRRVCRQRCR